MGIGHLAVGFASKRAAPRTSLGLLLLAGMFVDVLWAIFTIHPTGYPGPPPPSMNAVVVREGHRR